MAAAIGFWSFDNIQQTAAARKHGFIVLSKADGLLSALKDAETGQRGYLLTGDTAYLQPYLAVRGSVTGDLDTLRKLTKISKASQHLATTAPLITAKMAELAYLIELRQANKIQFDNPALRERHRQACIDKNANHKNTIWINNSVKNKRIYIEELDEYLISGYTKGRLLGDIKFYKHGNRNRNLDNGQYTNTKKGK